MSQVGNQHTTPTADDAMQAIREGLTRHFAEMGLTVDLDAPLPTATTDADAGTVVACAA